MMNQFWDRLLAGSSPNNSTSVDNHLGGKSLTSSFEGVRSLTDKMRAANALPLPVEAGTKVVFAGGMGAYLSYEECPSEGSIGEVVKVRSAAGDVTHHDGKVFVQWSDGKFRGIHAEHLRLASSGKTPWVYMSNSQRQRAAKHWTKERELAEHVWEDPDRLKEVVTSAARDGLVWDGGKYIPDVFDPKRHVIMKRVASLGDLTQFLKRADGKLIHKSTNDLWSYSKDADGNYVIERLFDDEGAPLRDLS